MAAVTTLFTPEAPLARLESSGTLVALYAFVGILWLGLAVANFRDGHHANRGWMQAVAGILYFISMAVHLSRWLKNRRAV